MTERVVLCMRWGKLYPSAYVNVLKNAVRDHLTGDVRFVCLTDEPDGLDPDIEHYPIPDLGYSERHWRHGAWPKLGVFRKDLYGLTGRALFIDLDSFIVGDLDRFFQAEGNLLAIGAGKNWRRGRTNRDPQLATGVFAFDLGAQSHIVDAFMADPKGASERFNLDQDFVAGHIAAWKPWNDTWVTSFKRHLCRPVVIDRLLPPRLPDPGTGIVAFHGDPRPIDVLADDGHNWAESPRYGRSPVQWVRDYWLRYGGEEIVRRLDSGSR